MKSKTFLVTGASGFLGYHMCNYLIKKGQKVAGIDIQKFDYSIKNKINFVKGDIRDKSLVRKIMKEVDVVIHCAAALPLYPKKEILSVDVDGTKIILQTAYDIGIKRVVFISSTAVYGIPKKHPINENCPLKGVGLYGESKIKAEKICLNFRKKGMCVPILRPKTFAGPLRLGIFQILCDWVKDGKNIPIIGSGENKYQLLHVDDLVDAIYLASTSSKNKANDTFNIGAVEFDAMKEDLQKLLDYAGFGKRVIPICSLVAIPALKIFEYLNLSPLYEWIYETASIEHYVSINKIQRVFGWKPKKSTADTWIDTYKWYLNEYKNYEKRTGVTHRTAWRQGILRFIKPFF